MITYHDVSNTILDSNEPPDILIKIKSVEVYTTYDSVFEEHNANVTINYDPEEYHI